MQWTRRDSVKHTYPPVTSDELNSVSLRWRQDPYSCQGRLTYRILLSRLKRVSFKFRSNSSSYPYLRFVVYFTRWRGAWTQNVHHTWSYSLNKVTKFHDKTFFVYVCPTITSLWIASSTKRNKSSRVTSLLPLCI